MDEQAPETLLARVNGREWRLKRPADLDALWSLMDDSDLERIPYWVELWPAGLFLARWLDRQEHVLAGKRALDVGCGLGLTACVATAHRARVTALDYELEALRYARENAELNGVAQPDWVQMDWWRPGIRGRVFDFVWGADIFYETHFFEPLVGLFELALAPGGMVWITEPLRDVSRPVWNRVRARGWKVDLVTREVVNYRDCSMRVNLWELRREADRRDVPQG